MEQEVNTKNNFKFYCFVFLVAFSKPYWFCVFLFLFYVKILASDWIPLCKIARMFAAMLAPFTARENGQLSPFFLWDCMSNFLWYLKIFSRLIFHFIYFFFISRFIHYFSKSHICGRAILIFFSNFPLLGKLMTLWHFESYKNTCIT